MTRRWGLRGRGGRASSFANASDAELAAAVADVLDDILDGAPSALNTLNEIAAAINDDATFAATVTAAIATKAPVGAPFITATADGTLTNDTALATCVGRDTIAARPAANTVPTGATYYATDLKRVYRSDGAAWTEIGPWGQYIPVGTGYLDMGAGITPVAVVNQRVQLMPFWLPQSVSLIGMRAEVTIAGGAGSTVNLLVYNSSPTTYMPTGLFKNGGTIDGTSVSEQEVTFTAAPMAAGLYWVGGLPLNNASAPTMRQYSTSPVWSQSRASVVANNPFPVLTLTGQAAVPADMTGLGTYPVNTGGITVKLKVA